MIDIVIPAYNAHNFICNLLFSISTQTILDKIVVYIINDCSVKNYYSERKKFKNILNIKEYKTYKNSGPGASRQLGLKKSHSEYIMFIDADDILYDCFSVETLYNKIEKENLNVVSSNFVEEVYDGSFYNHGANTIWMHGKIYKRDFLEKNRIFFNDTRANEDTGFNKLILSFTDFTFINDFTYIWKCNNTSITRAIDYTFYGLEGFCYNICWAIEEAKKRNANETRIAEIVYESIIDLYYRYVYYKDRDNKYLILDWTKKLKQYYLYYKDIITPENKEEVVFRVINFHYYTYLKSEAFLSNNLSFYDFIDLIQ